MSYGRALLLAMALTGCATRAPKPVPFDWHDCMGDHLADVVNDVNHGDHPGEAYGCIVAEHCYRVTCREGCTK